MESGIQEENEQTLENPPNDLAEENLDESKNNNEEENQNTLQSDANAEDEGLENTELGNSQLDDTNLLSDTAVNLDEKLEEYGVKIDDVGDQNENVEPTVTNDEAENDQSAAEKTSEEKNVEQSDAARSEDHEEDEELKKIAKHHAEKKEIKRKQRHRKIQDGNLIPEEDSDNENKLRSPGPPPLEPVSQNLDDEKSHGGVGFNRADMELLDRTSPDKMDVTLDEEYQEIQMEVKPTRDELIARYHQLIEEKEKLASANNQFHHKLADYFRKKKPDDTQTQQQLFEKNSPEQEQRYQKQLVSIEELKKKIENEKISYEHELDEIKDRCDIKQGDVNKESLMFKKMKRDSAEKSISTQSGKAPSRKEIDQYFAREQSKDDEVNEVRLENIKLKNQLAKKERELKAKEELGDGLHMIDFEQLKIENQTYNEKIEERNEELSKLKRKINHTVQILTHIKEKLQFVTSENDREKEKLNEFDEEVKKKRDILNKTKQSRDMLRMDNAKLKQNSGLLGNTILLRDFEDCVDKCDFIKAEIRDLKQKHAEYVLNSKILKEKINEVKSNKIN